MISNGAGNSRVYELRARGFIELEGWLAPYRRLWRGSLDALERHLEEME